MHTGSTSKRICIHESSEAPAAAVMDPDLWSTLPHELLLQVYTSLPINDFYKLRQVCKGWNQEASLRRCSTDPIRKPYFVVMKHNKNRTDVEIICYNISLDLWMSMSISTVADFHFDPIGDTMEPFIMEGIVFGKGCYRLSVDPSPSREHFFCFDIQVLRSIIMGSSEPPRRRVFSQKDSAVGMMVDTSTKPHVVKVIIGTLNKATVILNSETKAWETRPSQMIRRRPRSHPTYTPKSCISCGGMVYIWADLDEIQVYSVAEDRWSTLDPPPCHPYYLDTGRGLGHWQNEVYAVTRAGEFSTIVWKLAPSQKWEQFELMPLDMWDHMADALATIPFSVKRLLMVNYCGEYFLMHVLPTHGRPKSSPYRHVLFSLASKRWEMVVVPVTVHPAMPDES